MTTTEATMMMYQELSALDRRKVDKIVKQLFVDKKTKSPFQRLTKKQILSILDESETDIKAGRTTSARVDIERTRAKYGL